MNPDEHVESLIGSLVAAGVDLAVDGNHIIFNGPEQALAPDIIDSLRENKVRVVSLLNQGQRRGVQKLAPTSWEQRRMDWRCRTDRNPATYNVCLRFELQGSIDPSFLKRIINALVARHEILRTRFAWYGDYLIQEILEPPRTQLQILEPDALLDASESELVDWCMRRGAAAFNLDTESPVRWCYALTGQDSAILLLTMHHITCDGWSLGQIMDEFKTLCCAGGRGDDASILPCITMTPADFARWELGWLTEERRVSAQRFWSEELRGVALAPALMRAKATRRELSGDAGCIVHKLSAPIVAKISQLARSLKLSEFSLYFAAYAMLIREMIVEDEFAIVIAVANRTNPDQEKLVGLTRNASPIRCCVNDGDTLEIVSGQISAAVERVLPYQWYPLELIVPPQHNGHRLDIRRLPLTFGFERCSEFAVRCKDFSATVHDVFLGAARAQFSLLVRRINETAEVNFEYSESLLCMDEVRQLANRYEQIIVSNLGKSVESI